MELGVDIVAVGTAVVVVVVVVVGCAVVCVNCGILDACTVGAGFVDGPGVVEGSGVVLPDLVGIKRVYDQSK